MASEAMVCVMSYSTNEGPDGYPATFKEGARLESTAEEVKRRPQLWARESSPDEAERKRRALMVEAQGQTHYNTIPILSPRYRAKRKVTVDVDGETRSIKRGELVETNDLAVQLMPAGFELVQIKEVDGRTEVISVGKVTYR